MPLTNLMRSSAFCMSLVNKPATNGSTSPSNNFSFFSPVSSSSSSWIPAFLRSSALVASISVLGSTVSSFSVFPIFFAAFLAFLALFTESFKSCVTESISACSSSLGSSSFDSSPSFESSSPCFLLLFFFDFSEEEDPS